MLGVDGYFVLARFITIGIFYGVLGAEPLGEGVADDTARWRVVARHDDVAGARGRLSPFI